MNLNQVTLSVTDMATAVQFYTVLGFQLIVDTPHYARFECPTGEATFSLSLTDSVSDTGTTIYFEHEALDEWVLALQKQGVVFQQQPRDERYLWREAVLMDPSNNKIKLYWAGDNRRNPPWRVNKEN